MGPVVHFVITDAEPLAEGCYYYVRVTQVDGEMAWSSPVWTANGE